MTLNKLRAGDVLAGVGGVALLVATFLPWYEVIEGVYDGGRTIEIGDTRQNAWESFRVLLIPLVITALLGITLFVTTAYERTTAWPVAAQVFGAAIGALTTLWILFRVIDSPFPDFASSLQVGAWLGLASVVAVTAGAWWSMGDEVRP